MRLPSSLYVPPQAKKSSFNYLNAWLGHLNLVHKYHLHKKIVCLSDLPLFPNLDQKQEETMEYECSPSSWFLAQELAVLKLFPCPFHLGHYSPMNQQERAMAKRFYEAKRQHLGRRQYPECSGPSCGNTSQDPAPVRTVIGGDPSH